MVVDDSGKKTIISDALVRDLTSEHRHFVEMYQDIIGAVSNRKYGTVAKHATTLHDRLHKHMHIENMQLYTELKRVLETANPDKRQIVHSLQREMFSIGRAAIDFIRQAETLSLNDANVGQFRTELETVGGILVRRIQQEEKVLYPLFLESTSKH